MQLINEVLHEHLYKGVLVYLNDILIYTETMAEHVKLIRAVLKKVTATQLYGKLSKCEFHQNKIEYLGYCISHEGMKMDPEKIKAVLEWAPPQIRKQLQRFGGFSNFYCQFILSFTQIALPTTNLKDKRGWKTQAESALEVVNAVSSIFQETQNRCLLLYLC